MIKVHLRKKKLKTGNFSLYIEYYKGVQTLENGKTKHLRDYEYLQLYLKENPKSAAEKKKNQEQLELAEQILAIRKAEVYQGRYNIQNDKKGKIGFLDFYEQKKEERYLLENLMKKVKGFSMGESTREYLTSDELQKLSNTPCKLPILKRAFLFSALTGIRWSDVNKLKWSEVREEGIDENGIPILRIVFKQKKTDGVEYLYISQQARGFLGKRMEPKERVFKGLRYRGIEKYVLQQSMQKSSIKR